MALSADEHKTATLEAPAVSGCVTRHEAFWQLERVDRPLLAYLWPSGLAPGISPAPCEVTPEVLRSSLRDELDLQEEMLEHEGVLDGDLFRCVNPCGSFPWMPAILGCNILVYPGSRTFWRQPLTGGWEQAREINLSTRSEWRDILIEHTQHIVTRFANRYPIAAPYLRGPVDLLSNVLGDAEMCFRLIDQPDESIQILENITNLWIDIVQELDSIIPRFAGGSFHPYGIWASGGICGFAVDASNILSPGMYREFFLPCDRRIAQSFDHVLVHTHSASSQHHESWLTIHNLAIQIVDDPFVNISWPDLVTACRRIQQAGHPLMLMARDGHYQEVLEVLSATGLAIRGYTPW